jgi:hypothetical protein
MHRKEQFHVVSIEKYCNQIKRILLLKMGVANDRSHLAGKTQEDNDLLKSRRSGDAKSEAQFFKISPAMQFQYQIEEIQKEGSPFTKSDVFHGSFAYVHSINFANKSQIS